MLSHPFGAGEVAIESMSCTIRFTIRVNVQHDPRNLSPVGSGRVGVEQAKVRDNVLLIVHRQRRVGRVLVRHGLGDLPALGVHALKIEGRLKTPEYVAAATRLYRAAIDVALGEAPPPADDDRARVQPTRVAGKPLDGS